MKHYDTSAWLDYIEERVPVSEREQYELHLYECDICLSNYMKCMEDKTGIPDRIVLDDEFTNRVMAAVESENRCDGQHILPFQTQAPKLKWYQHSLFHYAAAAAITLVLMSAGVFQTMMNRIGEVNENALQVTQHSISEELVQSAADMLDKIHPKTRGGFHNE